MFGEYDNLRAFYLVLYFSLNIHDFFRRKTGRLQARDYTKDSFLPSIYSSAARLIKDVSTDCL